MRMFFGVLSAVAFLLASRRFYLTENVGYDIGGLFLLLIGLQLFIAAIVFHEQHESRMSNPSGPNHNQEGAKGSPPSNQ